MDSFSRRWFMLSTGFALAGPAAVLAQATSMGSVLSLQAQLSGAAEVPPNKSSATGTLEGTFNKDTKILNYTVSYSGLSGAVSAGHFHGPAMPGAKAGVVLPFVDGLDSPIKGTAVLTEAQAADLQAGKWYVNLHTPDYPDGEIRGQVGVR